MKLAIQFPFEVKQLNKHCIEFDARMHEGPFFAQDAIEQLAPELSAIDQDKLAEDILNYAMGEAIKRSITVVPIFERGTRPDANAKYAD